MQTRKESLAEAAFNVLVSYLTGVASQAVVLPLFGIHVPLSTNLAMAAIYMAIGMVRSYAIRRWFNSGRAQAWFQRCFKKR